MTASQLITELQKMPPDAEVWHLWDGCLRTPIDSVWLSKSGLIGTGAIWEYCNNDRDRPVDAPTRDVLPHWIVGEKP